MYKSYITLRQSQQAYVHYCYIGHILTTVTTTSRGGTRIELLIRISYKNMCQSSI